MIDWVVKFVFCIGKWIFGLVQNGPLESQTTTEAATCWANLHFVYLGILNL